MKMLALLCVCAVSVSSFGIEFITEAQVAGQIGAQKVIEVNKFNVEALIGDTECGDDFSSKSGRAYVVKKGKEAALYFTKSGLRDLTKCTEL